MKNIFFFIVIFFFFSFILNGAEQITVSPGQIYVGTDITFQIINLTTDPTPPPSWTFDDGSLSKSGKTVHHFFKEAKTYTVRCTWSESGSTKEVTKAVTVNDNRTVSFTGSGYVSGMDVPFVTTNFKKPTLKWDFGDGHIKENGGKNETHAFQNPGNYTVKVFGYTGSPPVPKTCSINILLDTRSITINTSPSKAKHKVGFTANGFSSTNLKWKWGDGNEQNGGQNMDHLYNNQGTFAVKVKDLSNPSFPEVSIQCNVQADNRIININPTNPSLYQEITFNAVNFSGASLEWDFDDATTQTGGTMMKHSYSNKKQYAVKVKKAGSGNLPVEKVININMDSRKVEVMPFSLVVGQTATIKLVNSDAMQVNWKIGPGEMKMGSPKTVQHQFYDPGNFEIECQIQNQTPVKTRINVRDNRTISFSPKYVFEGAKATFDTRFFNTPSLKWDFGDGTVQTAGKRHSHIYRSPGRFVVEVFDFNGQSKVPVIKRLNILRENREISLGSQIVYKGSEIEAEAKNFRGYSIKWNFGDGMVKTGSKRIKYMYMRSGNFNITAIDFGGADTKKISKNIQVQIDNRKITHPFEMVEGEGYDMKLENVSGGNFEWRFSDGDRKSGISLKSKVFRYAGQHTVTISDRSRKYPPFEKKMTVKADVRSLKASPPFALPDEAINFSALQFKGPTVKWDFNDGTVIAAGQKNMAHKFKNLGKYKVKAIDFGGKSQKVFTKTILVSEFTPNFKITTIEVAFTNGKYYRVVPKKGIPPAYYVKIKAEGRGIIKGKWILDDMTMGLFETILRENLIVHLKGAKVAKLPLTDQGIHNFTFDFTNYRFDKKIPIIRYFVSLGGAIKIVSPESGSKVSQQSVKLKWFLKKKKANYEVTVSEIPFQFLRDDLIKWKKAGEKREMIFDLTPYKSGTWLYWYVREVDNSGDVLTTSEVSSFKVVK